MENIIVSKGIFKHDKGELPFISLFLKDDRYEFFIKTPEMLEEGAPYWKQLLYLFDSSGIEILSDDINTPIKFKTNINTHRDDMTAHFLFIENELKDIINYNLSDDVKLQELHKTPDTEILELSKNFILCALDSLINAEREHTTNKLISELKKHPIANINSIIEEFRINEINKIRDELIINLKNGIKPAKTRKDLSRYLELQHGIILRKNTGEIYKLEGKGYTFISLDDLIGILSDDLGNNIISDKDLTGALESISTRLEPTYNIVKFPNGLYDMEKMELITPETPIFSLVESNYNYNPNAESTVLKQFLYSSLERETVEETERTIKGLKQLIGYLFTSGNKYNFLPVIAGVSGGGKSVLTNLLTNIFGTDKIADLSLQEMEKNVHGTSSLANKHLNFIRDSGNGLIEDNGTIKKLTGNESIQVNPKFKKPYILEKEEIPKTMLICNNIPRFKTLETAIIERLLIIEFNIKFRGTERENPNLETDILNNPEELEWLIYESLKEYGKTSNKQDFILKLTPEETRKLTEKHTNPLQYLLSLVIDEHNPIEEEETVIIANELNKVLIRLGEIEGVDIELNKQNKIPPRKLLNAIKQEYDLQQGEIIPDIEGNYKNRDYTTRTQRLFDRESNKYAYLRVYPNLKAKKYYNELLEEIY